MKRKSILLLPALALLLALGVVDATAAGAPEPEKRQFRMFGVAFYNPFWKKLDDGIGSYIYRGKWNLFDQIIINRNLLTGIGGLTFKDAIVFNKEFLKKQEGSYKGYPLRTFSGGVWTGGYSDHFPTEIFLVQPMNQH